MGRMATYDVSAAGTEIKGIFAEIEGAFLGRGFKATMTGQGGK